MARQDTQVRPDSWYRPRGYKHLDSPIAYERIKSYVQDPLLVAKHPFFPFIHYNRKNWRYDRLARKVMPKDRPIHYCSHRDAHVFCYYAMLLNEKYEAHLVSESLTSSVLAYRSLGKSNIDFAKDAFGEIIERKDCAVLCIDISQFFGSLDHKILLSTLREVLQFDRLPDDWYAVYRNITNYSEVELSDMLTRFPNWRSEPNWKPFCSAREFRQFKQDSFKLRKNLKPYGIPQGSPISGTLSNVYMLPYDRVMQMACSERRASYRRYSDDILIVCNLENTSYFEELRILAEHQANAIGLNINSDKTEVRYFYGLSDGTQDTSAPLQYLGFTYDGKKILIRSSSLARFFRRMTYAVRKIKRTKAKSGDLSIIPKRNLYEKFSHLGKKRTFIDICHESS